MLYCCTDTGDYEITFTYFGEPITTVCCVAKAWDPCAIKITGIKAGTISKPTTFVGMLSGLHTVQKKTPTFVFLHNS